MTIPVDAGYVDVAITPVGDGVWEWPAPETVKVTLMPSSSYNSTQTTVTATISDPATPTFTPVVDDTTQLSDDYSQVGVPVDVGYQIAGQGVLTHGAVVFSIQTGPGQFADSPSVSFSTDSYGNAYVFTRVVPTAPADIQVSAMLVQEPGSPKAPPAKALPAVQVAGITININSEGSEQNKAGEIKLDGRIRNADTPLGMADRIPPKISTSVWVYVDGNVPDTANLGFLVEGQSNTTGTVKVVAGINLLDITTPVAFGQNLEQVPGAAANHKFVHTPIQGVLQTAPGSSGKLVYSVVDINKVAKVNAKSSGFSVAAIPVGIEISKVAATYSPGTTALLVPKPDLSNYIVRFGQRYNIRVISDSGNDAAGTAQLDQVNVLEVLSVPVFKSVPIPGVASEDNKSFFAPLPPVIDAQTAFIAATSAVLGDDIAIAFGVNANNDAQAASLGRNLFLKRATQSDGGTLTLDQYFTFTDARTGSGSLVVANSGFTHLLKVPYPGPLAPGVVGYTRATMEVTKKPGAVKIGTVTVAQGNAVGDAEKVVSFEVTAP